MSARRVATELKDIVAGGPAATGIEGSPARERLRPPLPSGAATDGDGDGAHVSVPDHAPATPFIGRGPELAELAELFRDPAVRLVTIVGAGGMGKSRLAIEAARLMATGRGAFEETVRGAAPVRPAIFLVELAPLGSPDLLTTAIAGAVGLTFLPGA